METCSAPDSRPPASFRSVVALERAFAAEKAARTAEEAATTAKAVRAAKAAERAAAKAGELGPEKQVLSQTGTARRTYAEQKALRSAERGKRAAKLGPAFEQAGGGVVGHRAALRQLKGELPKLQFDKLAELDAATMDKLLTVVHQHADLRPFEKVNLGNALIRAHEGGVPRPFEIKLMERAFGPEVADELAKTRPLMAKVKQAIGEVANLPRSILASADVSAPFRQGLLAGASNPRIFAKNLGPMFRMFASEKRYGQVMDEIASRPSYATMLDANLKLTDLGDLTGREEMFMSNLAEKVTGGKYGIVRASSRAYVGFLNRMRADLFDHLVGVAESQGIETPKVRRDIARFVNVATGRGELGKTLEPAAVALNSVLFSPRLFAARINALNPLWYASLDPFVRKQAVSALVKLIGAGTTVLTLAKLAGAQVSTDPRNADFGKIRIGNTRLDIWGGHQQLVRLFAQVEQGKIVSSTSGKTLRLTGGHSLSRQDVVWRFGQGKLSPTPSLINDWFKGTDFADKPFSWKRAVVSRAYPLVIQDVRDAYHSTGSIPAAAGIYGIGALGIGVQTYRTPPSSSSGDPLGYLFGGGSSNAPSSGTSGDPLGYLFESP